MRSLPTEPIPIILAKEIYCAGCVDNAIRSGYSFLGSDAVFCHNCADFLARERRRHQIEFETRDCITCNQEFRAYSSSDREECRVCKPYVKERKLLINFDKLLVTV